MGYTSVRKCIQIEIEIERRFNLIHEKEWIGDTVFNICKRYGNSRKTYYKWKNRYKQRSNCSERNYIISCLDDCSRKVASKWSERKRSVNVLDVLEDWIMNNGRPKSVMHDNGKQFTSNIFRHFLVHNQIKDKRIPNFYPQLQGKVEAYNKIVKNEFLALENIPNIDDGKLRYDTFVKAYNEEAVQIFIV